MTDDPAKDAEIAESNARKVKELYERLGKMVTHIQRKDFYGSVGLTVKSVGGKLSRVEYTSKTVGDA